MKTNIKLRVTPEQSEAIQKICFANGIFWYAGNAKEVRYPEAAYLFIESGRIWFRGITDHNIGTVTEGYTEVDADLFIRTNGTCEEPEEIIKVCGEEYVLTNEDKEYLYSKRLTSLPSTAKKQSATEPECQFAKYGFEKPDFECELFGTVSGPFENDQFVVGAIKKGMFNNCPHMWSVKYGTCYTSTLATNMPEYNLTPIKKPWYETCKFPCLITADCCMPVSVHYFKDGYVYDFRGNKYCVKSWRLLTNDEIEELKQ